jgi:hypothetical protein
MERRAIKRTDRKCHGTISHRMMNGATSSSVKKHRFNEALSMDEEPSLMVGAESCVQQTYPGDGT